MLGPLIAGAAALGGGFLNMFGAQKANATASAIAARNTQMQQDFATHGIRWRVADAQKAGIHPLYALGAPSMSFAPQPVGQSNEYAGPAAGLAAAGQDISRAIDASRTPTERVDAVQSTAAALNLQNMQLRNELLSAQIAKIRQSGQPASVGMPESGDGAYLIPGQAQTVGTKPDPLKTTPAHPSQPSVEQGAVADVGYARTTTGWAPVPSKDVKERIEDQLIPELMWALRNNVFPSFGHNQAPPPFPAPSGQRWVYNPLSQEYQLRSATTGPGFHKMLFGLERR